MHNSLRSNLPPHYGLSRRTLLQVGGLSALGLTSSQLSRLRAAPADDAGTKQRQSKGKGDAAHFENNELRPLFILFGINIKLFDLPNARWRGGYSSASNEIRLNVAHHSSIEEMAVTFIHEAIHAWGIRGTVLSDVIARVGSGNADTLCGSAVLTAMTICQYGGRLPLLGIGEGGILVSLFSTVDE